MKIDRKAGCAILVVVGMFWAMLVAGVALTGKDEQPFDSAAWIAAGSPSSACNHDGPRPAMVRDLQARALPQGMPKADVLALLGPPDQQPGDESGSTLHYCVGSAGLFPIDDLILELDFDAAGRLHGARLRER